MRIADLLGMAFAALWQQKVRTLLTMLGVVFGSFVLAASLSVGQGVQNAIARAGRENNFLQRILVQPDWRGAGANQPGPEIRGEMSAAKRERIRKAIVARQVQSDSRILVRLTQEKLRTLAALDHVADVVPVAYQNCIAVLDDKSQMASLAPARLDSGHHRQLLIAGRYFEDPAERALLVNEFLLYRWGLVDDHAITTVLGKKVRVEFNAGQPESRLVEEFTLVGVIRLPTKADSDGPWDPLNIDADVLLPPQTATGLFFRVPGHAEQGVDQAIVIVDREENVKEVARQVTEMGLQHHSRLEFIEQQRLIYLLIFSAMTCIAAVAVVVAALGIANTMLMSVLERTREIGIMKAVGAGNIQLQLIFLVEGSLLGLVGGGLGLLLAWGASFPADAWTRSMVSRDLKVELKESLFVFPMWLAVAAPLFAVVVTTLAAVFPARRAARVDTVAALRHE